MDQTSTGCCCVNWELVHLKLLAILCTAGQIRKLQFVGAWYFDQKTSRLNGFCNWANLRFANSGIFCNLCRPGKLQELALGKWAQKTGNSAKTSFAIRNIWMFALKENGITLNSKCLINFDKVCERIDRTFRRAHIKAAIWRGLQQWQYLDRVCRVYASAGEIQSEQC